MKKMPIFFLVINSCILTLLQHVAVTLIEVYSAVRSSIMSVSVLPAMSVLPLFLRHGVVTFGNICEKHDSDA